MTASVYAQLDKENIYSVSQQGRFQPVFLCFFFFLSCDSVFVKKQIYEHKRVENYVCNKLMKTKLFVLSLFGLKKVKIYLSAPKIFSLCS